MRGRKRLRAVTLSNPIPTTFDLRDDYLERPKDAGTVEVQNPHNAQQTIIIFRKLRDDPLGRLHDRGQIHESEYRAGRHWQQAYERAEISGARAIDPTREAVDGGQIAQASLSDDQAKAFATLSKAARAVGFLGVNLLVDILAHGMTTDQVAKSRGHSDERGRRYYGMLFRDILHRLSIEFGFSNERLTSLPARRTR